MTLLGQDISILHMLGIFCFFVAVTHVFNALPQEEVSINAASQAELAVRALCDRLATSQTAQNRK